MPASASRSAGSEEVTRHGRPSSTPYSAASASGPGYGMFGQRTVIDRQTFDTLINALLDGNEDQRIDAAKH